MPFAWSPDRVRDVLVELFRARPTLPVYSGWAVAPVVAIAGIDIELNWQRRFLSDDPEGWLYLKSWAWCRAHRESTSERIRSAGWSRKAFENGVRRAAAVIATGLNRERVNAAQRLAGEAAETRLAELGRVPAADAPRPWMLTRGKPAPDVSARRHGAERCAGRPRRASV